LARWAGAVKTFEERMYGKETEKKELSVKNRKKFRHLKGVHSLTSERAFRARPLTGDELTDRD